LDRKRELGCVGCCEMGDELEMLQRVMHGGARRKFTLPAAVKVF